MNSKNFQAPIHKSQVSVIGALIFDVIWDLNIEIWIFKVLSAKAKCRDLNQQDPTQTVPRPTLPRSGYDPDIPSDLGQKKA